MKRFDSEEKKVHGVREERYGPRLLDMYNTIPRFPGENCEKRTPR